MTIKGDTTPTRGRNYNGEEVGRNDAKKGGNDGKRQGGEIDTEKAEIDEMRRRGQGPQGGTQAVGDPFRASQNTSHDVCRGSFSPSPTHSIPQITPFPNAGVTNSATTASDHLSKMRISNRQHNALRRIRPTFDECSPPSTSVTHHQLV